LELVASSERAYKLFGKIQAGIFSAEVQVRFYRKMFGGNALQTEALDDEHRRRENRGTEGAEWGKIWERK